MELISCNHDFKEPLGIIVSVTEAMAHKLITKNYNIIYNSMCRLPTLILYDVDVPMLNVGSEFRICRNLNKDESKIVCSTY